ncbi:tRNA (guanine-n(7)-)-methyltransferase non-catalytic subunit [Plakobranchus ocellatus]|uniref:tRNA (guanine-N(7)-)-methyltransferase non-catalytic subunit n=1 Tax=Plakobranchus ocellatus TaxID=259542 RepID=A0AAV3ZLS7_9GAST|nr:tRNA (guanine-n(7)-)-methyltransferase non-catalytic subunit [Plakobranchus ocellatus]
MCGRASERIGRAWKIKLETCGRAFGPGTLGWECVAAPSGQEHQVRNVWPSLSFYLRERCNQVTVECALASRAGAFTGLCSAGWNGCRILKGGRISNYYDVSNTGELFDFFVILGDTGDEDGQPVYLVRSATVALVILSPGSGSRWPSLGALLPSAQHCLMGFGRLPWMVRQIVCAKSEDDRERKGLLISQQRDNVEWEGQMMRKERRCTARRCTDVCFSPDDSLVLVADKSGDAYSFPTLCQDQNPDDKDGNEDDKDLHSAEQAGNSEGQTEEDGRGDVDSKEAVLSEGDKLEVEVEDEDDFERQRGSGEGTLILGHLSMLLGVRLVDNGQLVVTCDRDEKIRVSNFPDAYNIHSYCLGHTEFVIDLAYDEANKILLSASGDCTVRAWSLDGTQVCQRNILEDLPQELHPKAAPAPAADGSDQGNSQPSNEHRTSIRKMSYCAECNLLFVALERSPHILVYRLDIEQPSSAGCQTSLHLMTVLRGRSALDHSQAPEKPDLSRASATGDATVVSTPETAVAGGESREASVAGLCAQGSVLWVLRRQQEKLWLTAHAFCLKQSQELQISEIASESNESQILKTVSEQIGFLTVLPDAEDLLPFLWKYSFQDDFKLQCNLKRAQPERKEGEHNRKGRSRKKAKRGEKGR